MNLPIAAKAVVGHASATPEEATSIIKIIQRVNDVFLFALFIEFDQNLMLPMELTQNH